MSRMMQRASTSEPKETQPLVRQDTDRLHKINWKCRECCPIRYRFVSIPEKGAIFMVVLNTFFLAATLSCIDHAHPGTLPGAWLWNIILGALGLVLCPVVGLLSDCYFGRYKVLRASVCILLLGIVLKAIEILLSTLDIIILNNLLTYTSSVLALLSLGLYVSCVIPFTMDQLVGASGE